MKNTIDLAEAVYGYGPRLPMDGPPTPPHIVRTFPVLMGFGVLKRYPPAVYDWYDGTEQIADPEARLNSDRAMNRAFVLVEADGGLCDVYRNDDWMETESESDLNPEYLISRKPA